MTPASLAEGEPSAGVFAGGEHRLPVRVYYEDTDFTGRVYHASYVRFLERGRSDFLRVAGADHRAMGALGAAFAVVRLEIDFRHPAGIDDALVVSTRLEPVRGARMRFSQRVERAGAVICTAEVKVACIGRDGRVRRPPRELLALLAAVERCPGRVRARPTTSRPITSSSWGSSRG